MSKLDLDAIEARAKAATPGPWTADTKYASGDFGLIVGGDLGFARDGVPDGTTWKVAYVCYDNGDRPEDEDRAWYDEEDAEFIAHAREDVPALIAELRRLREENRWIPVEERLPERRGVYLVYVPGHDYPIHSDYYDGDEFPRSRNKRTHWRPLPKPPEVGL